MNFNTDAIKYLLYILADDDLIIGHRNSEWTGFGPILEEDIAFASMAQDCVGHALSYYSLLHDLGEKDPDTIAFTRPANEFRSCHLVELPIGDYAFSLVRHFYYDYAKSVRLKALLESKYLPLQELAKRIASEHKYHVLHAKTWIVQLLQGTESAKLRIQSELEKTIHIALGLFEDHPFSVTLAEEGVIPLDSELKNRWLVEVSTVLEQVNIYLPENLNAEPYSGGRKGYHSEYLQDLLDEMTVVFRSDPTAIW